MKEVVEVNIYPDDHVVYCDGREVYLTGYQWKMLLVLVDGTQSYECLQQLTNIYSNRSMWSTISTIRKRLGVKCISTKQGRVSIDNNVRVRIYK